MITVQCANARILTQFRLWNGKGLVDFEKFREPSMQIPHANHDTSIQNDAHSGLPKRTAKKKVVVPASQIKTANFIINTMMIMKESAKWNEDDVTTMMIK